MPWGGYSTYYAMYYQDHEDCNNGMPTSYDAAPGLEPQTCPDCDTAKTALSASGNRIIGDSGHASSGGPFAGFDPDNPRDPEDPQLPEPKPDLHWVRRTLHTEWVRFDIPQGASPVYVRLMLVEIKPTGQPGNRPPVVHITSGHEITPRHKPANREWRVLDYKPPTVEKLTAHVALVRYGLLTYQIVTQTELPDQ